MVELVDMMKDTYNQYNFNSVIDCVNITIPMMAFFIKKMMKDKKYYTHRKQIIFNKNKLLYVSNLGLYKNIEKINI
jgi:hypothetical protein